MCIINEITVKVCEELTNKFESLIIEGLKLKGYEFENKIDLEKFVKENCRCQDYADVKQRTYFVKDEPFFFHDYNIIYEPIKEYDRGIKMSANYGLYKFL